MLRIKNSFFFHLYSIVLVYLKFVGNDPMDQEDHNWRLNVPSFAGHERLSERSTLWCCRMELLSTPVQDLSVLKRERISNVFKKRKELN